MSFTLPPNYLAIVINGGLIGIGIAAIWMTRKFKIRTRNVLTIILGALCCVFSISMLLPTEIKLGEDGFSYSSFYLSKTIDKASISKVELYSTTSAVPYDLSMKTFGIGLPGFSLGYFYIPNYTSSFLNISGNNPVVVVSSQSGDFFAVSVSQEYVERQSMRLGIPLH